MNEQHPLRVFVQLEGDCKGVFVTNKTSSGFDVVELDGGSSSVPFAWTIAANRADEVNPDGTIAHYSAERFHQPGPQKTVRIESRETDGAAVLQDTKDQPLAPPVNLSGRSHKTRQ